MAQRSLLPATEPEFSANILRDQEVRYEHEQDRNGLIQKIPEQICENGVDELSPMRRRKDFLIYAKAFLHSAIDAPGDQRAQKAADRRQA